jgi:iron complex outermembrane recepter protein
MIMMETVLARSVRLIFSGGMAVVGVGLLAQPAMAQQDAGGSSMQRVEITGSNIRRAQTETASAVQTLKREDIERSGKTTVAELLQTLAVDNQGSVPMTFGSGFASGASGISLRGLGAASTLVLINGRRVAPYGLADDAQKVFADLNIIPVEAVERVEILKDGASSIYGSDAIAGVVNVILRRDYVGSVGKVSYGQSKYHDGEDFRASVTHGFGDLDKDRFNVLLNFEYGKKGDIKNADRSDRGNYIGRADLRGIGFGANELLGGTGAITGTNAAGASVTGNVRNPANNEYFGRETFFPGANCAALSGGHPQAPQTTAAGYRRPACLIDAAQRYGLIQPEQETFNFFSRGTFNISADMQAYGEFNLYRGESKSQTTPNSISTSWGAPTGAVSNAAVALGPTHPDNPFAGTAARLRYLPADVGPRTTSVESTFTRLLGGVKGTMAGWDYDTALLYSENKLDRTQNGYLRVDAVNALLNPTAANVARARANNPAYAALPAGTVWRIAENAGLNSAGVYAALAPTLNNDAKTQVAQIDLKVSRELGQLAGGPIGVALGAEYRHEKSYLNPTPGTETGEIIGLGYSAFRGSRSIAAVYGEVLAPVLKTLELSAALRADRYSDVGNSVTPKVGAKWTPTKEFALRGTYAEGFRAPSAPETGGGSAAFSTSDDPVRCALGVATACSTGSVALITASNSGLQPEKSKSYSLGMVWDPLPRTSISVDLWQIDRRNEINQESTAAALAAGRVSRDPSTAQFAGDPGAITAINVGYVNSNQTRVQGVDLDLRQGFDLGTNGKLSFDAKWTHLFKWLRTEVDGTQFEYAGTHGNCDVTNCIGTPDDRINLGATWERGAWKVSTLVNHRGSFSNKLAKDDADCGFHDPAGNDYPNGCKIASFTTVDVTFRYQPTQKIEVFGGIQNLLDKQAPHDPVTYGAQSFNPLDYYGAVGRYFNIGLKYKF